MTTCRARCEHSRPASPCASRCCETSRPAGTRVAAQRPAADRGADRRGAGAYGERVLEEAKGRLAEAHAAAPRVDAVNLAEASRLRNEWRYSVHVDAWGTPAAHPPRRTGQAGSLRRFSRGVRRVVYEDLSMVGTGFGDTTYDVAIREAATVVSMAEQRCHKLAMELEEARRNESVREAAHSAKERDRGASPNLGELDADRADRLIARALAELDDTAYVRPLVIDCVLDALAPDARRRVYDRLVAHARRRQVVLVTAVDEIARWAAHGSPADVALRLDFANLSHRLTLFRFSARGRSRSGRPSSAGVRLARDRDTSRAAPAPRRYNWRWRLRRDDPTIHITIPAIAAPHRRRRRPTTAGWIAPCRSPNGPRSPRPAAVPLTRTV